MNAFLFDLKYAARRLRHSAGFTTVVLLTLALGIGANSAIFSVVNTVLLQPLPYSAPEQLVSIFHWYPTLKLQAPVSAAGFKDYHDRTHSFTQVAVEQGWNANITGVGEPERLRGQRMTAEFFSALGVRPERGRVPLSEEDAAGRNHVVVLSHGVWKRLFAADESVIGKKVSLNGEAYDIIGVMPSDFYDPNNRLTDVWAPLAIDPSLFTINNYTRESYNLVARLKPGVTVDQASREMDEFAKTLAKENPGRFDNWGLRVRSMTEVQTGNIRTALFVLLGAVGFVLLIACANVANLFLARAAGRQKEIAIRTALGARPWALVRQLLVESSLLAVMGGALGLLIAWGCVRALVAFNPGNIPRIQELSIDASVIGFTALVSLVTGMVFGIVPAIQVSRRNLQLTLKEGGRNGTADRSGQLVRRVLVVTEVALALTLLTGGGLLIKSFSRLSSVSPGFDATNVLTFFVGLPSSKYQNDTTRRAFYNEATTRMAALPGVKSAGAASVLPFSGGFSTGSFNVEGFTPAPGADSPWGDSRLAGPGYMEALRTPLIKGRFFDTRDVDGSQRVAIVDEEFTKRFYKPGEEVIGKRWWFGNSTANDSTRYFTIVGVVAHAKVEGLDADARVQYYRPIAQSANLNGMGFAVRTVGDPKLMINAIRRALHEVDADVPLSAVSTMDDLIEGSLGQRRLSTVLLGVFSGIALLLASLGIYGVMSYTVTQRTRELGVRMALGASQARVLGLVLGQGMILAVVGVGLGLGGAYGLTRFIATQLYGVGATDPATFAVVTAVLTSVALGASLIPAFRATRVDPIVALRDE